MVNTSKKSYFAVDPKYTERRSSFGVNPLSRMISSEDRRITTDRSNQLYLFLASSLTLDELNSLNKMLGRDWHQKINIPLWNDLSDFEGYLKRKLPEVRERLRILGHCNPQEVLKRFSLPYFLTTNREAILIYEEVLEERRTFPQTFFEYDEGRKAGVLTRNMYERILGFSPEQAFSSPTKRHFQDHKLGWMLTHYFRNNPHLALKNAYPQKIHPELYQNKQGDSLSHLVDTLDDLFARGN